MSEFKLTSVEEFEQATNELLENGAKVGADAWQFRVKNQTPHCKFGEQGTCCRICTMGPCRITPKAPRGICGCDVHGIVGRNFLRFTAGGSATHSDHGREICHTLHEADPNGNYKVKDPEKLIRIAKEWGVETEGKDIYDLAHEMSELALLEYGKPFGTQRFLKRAPQHTQDIWEREEIAPRAIDREVACSLHMTHMGCSSLPEALVRQSLRSGLSDGWGGSMMGTEFSDVLFGTPKPIETEANLGVMKEDEVNIIVHGHDPSLSEMICEYADDPEMIAYAKEMGAKGINVAGVCCTSNEVAMRRGVPMAGNFLQQENVVLTGACEAIVVDVQCIFPALGPLSKCFHTKFVTTSPIAQMPDAEYIRFNAKTAGENAKAIVKMAIENFKNRKPELVHIPHMKQKATVGYSFESIIKTLDKVTNSQVDQTGTLMPLWQCVASGVIRGAVAMVGCNNPKVRPDTAHIELMKKHHWSDLFDVDIMDAEGPDVEWPVENGKVLKVNYLGKNIENYDSMLVLIHFKGHPMGGYGGALKQLSIGCASSAGKTYIHTGGKVTDQHILWENCAEQDTFLEAMADAASTVAKHFAGKIAYVAIMKNLSVDCDCCAVAEDPCMNDVGILSSLDPVALDRACIDLVINSNDPGRDHFMERVNSRHGTHTIDTAEALGIGTQAYELVKV